MKHLLSHDALLGLGVCLIIAGIILRGLVREGNRAMALRMQHALMLRKSGEQERAEQVETETSHLEKWLPRYAAGCITIGLILVVASSFR